MPPNESPAVFAIVLVSTLLEYTAFIAMSALVSSMIADLAEDTELRTGRRAEGVLFAVRSFARKAVEGVGVMAAALILTLISFPEGRDPGEVPQAAIDRLGLFYFPVVLVLWLGMVILMLRYRINREDHEANLDALAARAAAQTEDP